LKWVFSAMPCLFSALIWVIHAMKRLFNDKLTLGINMKHKIIVKKSRVLARAYHNLSLIENRFINMCIGRTHKSTVVNEDTQLLVKVDRFACEFEITEKEARKQFKEIQKKLPNKTIILPEVGLEPIILVTEVEYSNNNEFYVKFDVKAINHVGNLRSKFIMYDISMINGMKSTYSIRLYEIFLTKKYGKGIQDLDIGVNELKMMLGVADKYSNIGDFNYILYKSIDEINELTDLTSKIEYKRRKTTIVGYIFKLEEKAKD